MTRFDTPPPIILTIKHYGKTLTAELPWDSPLDDVYLAIQGLLVADGFHNDGIENFIIEQGEELKELQKHKNKEDYESKD
jgi:hypothetical protein